MSAVRDIELQAALWLLRREEPGWSVGDQAALDAWLAESMEHKAAYWRLEHGWRAADRLAALGPAAHADGRRAPRPLPAISWHPLTIAASLLLLVGTVVALTLYGEHSGNRRAQVAEASFATPVGGRKILSLPDGSRAELNTSTAARVAMSENRREVWLDFGEAYFEVVHAAERPFIVHAGPRRITVLGTKFSVRRAGAKVTVAVVEGRVRIEPVGAAQDHSATITAGDIAIAEGAATLVAADSARRVANNLSWRRGVLTFDGATLGEVVAEFNRYNQRQVVVADPEIAAIRIGGTFRAANVEAFVRLLRDAYQLRVEEAGEEVTISG